MSDKIKNYYNTVSNKNLVSYKPDENFKNKNPNLYMYLKITEISYYMLCS